MRAVLCPCHCATMSCQIVCFIEKDHRGGPEWMYSAFRLVVQRSSDINFHSQINSQTSPHVVVNHIIIWQKDDVRILCLDDDAVRTLHV